MYCDSQLMEYSHLLDMADECEDPHMRLVYAGKCYSNIFYRTPSKFCAHLLCPYITWLVTLFVLFSASFFISVYYAYQRTWKPFNPILGETYEMVNHGGITFIAEQVHSNFDILFKTTFLLFSSVFWPWPWPSWISTWFWQKHSFNMYKQISSGLPSSSHECWTCWKWSFHLWCDIKIEN